MRRTNVTRLIWALPVVALVAAGIGLSQFKMVRLDDSKTRLAPYGYTYEGKSFSGVGYQKHPQGTLRRLVFIWKGKRHIGELFFYPNGQRQIQRRYWYGLPDGKYHGWYPDGSPRSVAEYSAGKQVGESWAWWDDGTTKHYALYENDEARIYKSFNRNGKPFNNYVIGQSRVGFGGERNCDPVYYSRR